MKRRILSVLMVAMLLFSTMAVTSFADAEEQSQVPDVPEAVALVSVDNVDCKVFNEIKDLNVTIKFTDGRTIAEIPVVKAEEADDETVALWLGYEPKAAITDAVKEEMTQIQKDFHLGSWEELKAVFESEEEGYAEKYLEDLGKALEAVVSSYTVELTGLPETTDHEFTTESTTLIMTSSLVKECLGIVKGLIGEVFELTDEEMAQITSFSAVIDVLEKEMIEMELLQEGQDMYDFIGIMMEEEVTAETRAEIEAAVAEVDAMLEYMTSEAYKGTVIAGVNVTCNCPKTVAFEIIHQYFKVKNGKAELVATVYEGDAEDEFGKYYMGIEGDVVKASDYINCEYNGETYNYLGSYDSFAIYETYEGDDYTANDFYKDGFYWEDSEVSEYTLKYDDWESPLGLTLRYEIVENTPATDATAEGTDDANGTPQTGDDSNMTPYVVIMFAAMAVMAAAVLVRRRQTN